MLHCPPVAQTQGDSYTPVTALSAVSSVSQGCRSHPPPLAPQPGHPCSTHLGSWEGGGCSTATGEDVVCGLDLRNHVVLPGVEQLNLRVSRCTLTLRCNMLPTGGAAQMLGSNTSACFCKTRARPKTSRNRCVPKMELLFRYFRNPCDCDPPQQQEISKTLNSSKIPSKYLTCAFGERTFTFGERTFTLGERTFTFRDNRGFRVFLNFFFCCWGVLGLRGSGSAARRGFRKYLSFFACSCAWEFSNLQLERLYLQLVLWCLQ